MAVRFLPVLCGGGVSWGLGRYYTISEAVRETGAAFQNRGL